MPAGAASLPARRLTRVVTASADKTALVWDVRPDTGTLADWASVDECSPFALVDGVLVHRFAQHIERKPSN